MFHHSTYKHHLIWKGAWERTYGWKCTVSLVSCFNCGMGQCLLNQSLIGIILVIYFDKSAKQTMGAPIHPNKNILVHRMLDQEVRLLTLRYLHHKCCLTETILIIVDTLWHAWSGELIWMTSDIVLSSAIEFAMREWSFIVRKKWCHSF